MEGQTVSREARGARHSRQTGAVTAGGPTTLGRSVRTVSRGEMSLVATRYRPWTAWGYWVRPGHTARY